MLAPAGLAAVQQMNPGACHEGQQSQPDSRRPANAHPTLALVQWLLEFEGWVVAERARQTLELSAEDVEALERMFMILGGSDADMEDMGLALPRMRIRRWATGIWRPPEGRRWGSVG